MVVVLQKHGRMFDKLALSWAGGERTYVRGA